MNIRGKATIEITLTEAGDTPIKMQSSLPPAVLVFALESLKSRVIQQTSSPQQMQIARDLNVEAGRN